MVYEQMSGFDWNAFSSIVSNLGQSASTIYGSYTNLSAARSAAKTASERNAIDLQIAQLQFDAAKLMAENGSGAQSETMKKILPLAVAGGASLLAIMAAK